MIETKTAILDIFNSQKEYFSSCQTLNLKFRKQSLKKLKEVIISKETAIFEALTKDLKKPEFETYGTEISLVIKEIDLHLSGLEQWSKSKAVGENIVNFPASSYVKPHPYGVNLIIGTWNYPLLLVLQPLVGAISSGNCAIVKPSEYSVHTSQLVYEIVNECFAAEHVSVVIGKKKEAVELLQLPFNHIFFTGSSSIATSVMKAAAENLTPVTLELGGKSPCIIDRDVDLKQAAKRIIWGKMLNGGQTCIAPDYVVVHKDDEAELLSKMERCIFEFYGHDPQQSGDFCRMISKRHYDRLDKMLDEVEIAIGGITDPEDLYISPTVVKAISWEHPIMQEEIFGPILPILTYDELGDAIDQIKKKDSPLSLYIFSENQKLQNSILETISFGNACINDTVMQFNNFNLPFGGVGYSGMGSYHGKSTFFAFSHIKSVQRRSKLVDVPLRYPPYKNKMKYLRGIIEWFG